ncbi:hypothetical protein [Thioalkalivibrio sp. ALJ1]|uniref:hypothetical protein n=1 Tax=Thioalkalivibrio sp. ALJ1 TaxID=1158144 RepID=UPI003527CF88
MMFGCPTDEAEPLMPLPWSLALHSITHSANVFWPHALRTNSFRPAGTPSRMMLLGRFRKSPTTPNGPFAN